MVYYLTISFSFFYMKIDYDHYIYMYIMRNYFNRSNIYHNNKDGNDNFYRLHSVF